MNFLCDYHTNPNPITKFLVVGLVGFTVLHSINDYFAGGIVAVISIMYFINGYYRDAIRNIIIFLFLSIVPNFLILVHFNLVIKMFLSLLFIGRIFYIPYSAGKFFIKTSDVGSIISSMDWLKMPSDFSIPIAVMFRFFPSFQEEQKHIREAMKIRGINTRNPLKYLEYVVVPLLIISSNIAEDIAKAAETKCIENPIYKTRYIPVTIHKIDFLYVFLILVLILGGWYVDLM